jgi:hypothetical protein
MKKVFVLLACLGGLAFGEDNSKCKQLVEWPEFHKENLKMPAANVLKTKTNRKCICAEIITCEKVEYCVLAKCPVPKQELPYFEDYEKNIEEATSYDL